MSVTIKVKRTDPRAILPAYQTAGASGLDLHAILEHSKFLAPGDRYLFSTGLSFEIPEGWEGQVRPRSGMSASKGLVCSFGTIDNDYTGQVFVCLYNNSYSQHEIRDKDRIAQIVFKQCPQVTLELVDALKVTERGKKGFGSSGV